MNAHMYFIFFLERRMILNHFINILYKKPLIYIVPSIFFLCILLVNFVDRPLALYCKTHLSLPWEGFFGFLIGLGRSWTWCVTASVAFLIWNLKAHYSDRMRKKRLRAQSRVVLWLLTAMLGSGSLVAGLKIIFGRARPRLLFEQSFYGFNFFSGLDWVKQSFPSGHSQAIWVVTTVMTTLWPRYRLFFLILGGFVSTSRVVTTVHYLSDAVMGTFLGIACTVLLRDIFYRQDRCSHTRASSKGKRVSHARALKIISVNFCWNTRHRGNRG